MKNKFLDIGYVTLNKVGEELCGDKVEFVKNDENSTIVLADGLGSGVKANILATLTSRMLCNMISNGLNITDAVETVARTLPVCKTRGVAYSTFSIISVNSEGKGALIEYDNPMAIILKDGKIDNPKRESLIISEKTIWITELDLNVGDVVVITSDGVIHAGIGKLLNFGWEREQVSDYFLKRAVPRMSARCLSSLIADACNQLYMGECGDDTTVAVLKVTAPYKVNLMVGPPAKVEFDKMAVEDFMSCAGAHVVCGGTTSQVVAKILGKEVSTDISTITEDIPPIGYIDGIDLVTEGVLTVKKLIEMCDIYLNVKSCELKQFVGSDGASRLGDMLFEKATEVNIFIGRGVNSAHAELDIANSMKLHLVEELAKKLKSLGKSVVVKYY